MRIISKFKDYYDSAMGHGVDRTKVFTRMTELVEYPNHGKLGDYPRIHGYQTCGPSLKSFDISSFIVLFAGKPYFGIRFYFSGEVKIEGHKWPVQQTNTHYCYDNETFLDVCKKYGFDPDYLKTQYYRQKELVEMSEFFNPTLDWITKLQEFALNSKVSIAVLANDRGVGRKTLPTVPTQMGTLGKIDLPINKDANTHYVLNPCLKDIQFYQVLDAFTAYQELEMWVGGILSNNPEIQPVPDKFKIQQHGYDEYSFRKLPTKRALKQI